MIEHYTHNSVLFYNVPINISWINKNDYKQMTKNMFKNYNILTCVGGVDENAEKYHSNV